MSYLRLAVGPLILTLLCAGVVYAIAFSTQFDPTAACIAYSRQLNSALIEYTQDYDERLPDMRTAPVFKRDLLPYVNQARYFVCPATLKPYHPNAALAFLSLAALSSLSTTKAFEDSVAHADGIKSITYLDGTVVRAGVAQGDTTQMCLDNVYDLSLGLRQYAQDYDDRLPLMNNESQLRSAVYPYLRDPRQFKCPVTGRGYVPNSSLSSQSLGSITEPLREVWTVADAVPHPDGISTVGFLDGHVTHASRTIGPFQTSDNLRALLLAIQQYAQDNSNVMPPMEDYGRFMTALMPYVAGPAVFYVPDTSTPYILNRSLSRKPISSITGNPVVIRSPVPDAAGIIESGHVDGSVTTTPLFFVRAMAVGADNETRLIWYSIGDTIGPGDASVWTLSAAGQVLTKRRYNGGGAAEALTVAPDSQSFALLDNDPRGAFDEAGQVTGFSGTPATYPLTPPSTVWSINQGGSVAARNDVGPFDSWTPRAISAVSGSPAALWTYYDGTAAIWELSATGGYVNSFELAPAFGSFATDLAQGPDGNLRLLWANSDGSATVTILSPTGSAIASSSIGPVPGESPVAVATDSSNNTLVLWSGLDSSAQVWTVSSTGGVLRTETFFAPGFKAARIADGADGNLRLLWMDPALDARLDIVQPDGTPVSSSLFEPYRWTR